MTDENLSHGMELIQYAGRQISECKFPSRQPATLAGWLLSVWQDLQTDRTLMFRPAKHVFHKLAEH